MNKPQCNSRHRSPINGVPTLAGVWSSVMGAEAPAAQIRGGIFGGPRTWTFEARGFFFDAWNGRVALGDAEALHVDAEAGLDGTTRLRGVLGYQEC